MRAAAEGVYLVVHLVFDPIADHVFGEDVALEQVVVVAIQRPQSLLERAGGVLDLGLLGVAQLIQVAVGGRAGVERATGLLKRPEEARGGWAAAGGDEDGRLSVALPDALR